MIGALLTLAIVAVVAGAGAASVYLADLGRRLSDRPSCCPTCPHVRVRFRNRV